MLKSKKLIIKKKNLKLHCIEHHIIPHRKMEGSSHSLGISSIINCSLKDKESFIKTKDFCSIHFAWMNHVVPLQVVIYNWTNISFSILVGGSMNTYPIKAKSGLERKQSFVVWSLISTAVFILMSISLKKASPSASIFSISLLLWFGC